MEPPVVSRPSHGGETISSTVPQRSRSLLGDQPNPDGIGMVVDVHTTVNERSAMERCLSHFLLRIVTGEIT